MGLLDPPVLTKQQADGLYAKSSAVNAATNMALRGFPRKSIPIKKVILSPGAAGHGIVTAGTGTNINLNDTSVYAYGNQCVSADLPSNGSYFQIKKTGMTPVSVVGENIRLLFRYDTFAGWHSGHLRLGSNNLADSFNVMFSYGQGNNPRSMSHRPGEMVSMDIGLGDFTVASGTPSWSNITDMMLLLYGINGQTTRVYFGGLATTQQQTRLPNGACVVALDDSSVSQDTIVRPYLDKYGYAATMYPIMSVIGTPGNMSIERIKALSSVNGWDIGLHASTPAIHTQGFDAMTDAEVLAEMQAQREWLFANGLSGDSFAYPLNRAATASGEAIISRFVRTARNGERTTGETLPPSLPYRIRAFALDDSNYSTFNTYIDRVKASAGLAVVTIHSVGSGGTLSTANMQAAVDKINAAGMQVLTMSQVADLAL